MQIPHSTVRSLSQRPITLDDDDDEDDAEPDVVAQAQAVQFQTVEERENFMSFSGGATMKLYDASFAASSGVMTNNEAGASKRLSRSKSTRHQDGDSANGSKSTVLGTIASFIPIFEDDFFLSLNPMVMVPSGMGHMDDEESTPSSIWTSFWTRTLSIITLGRRKSHQVAPEQNIAGKKRTLQQSKSSAIWLVSNS